MSRASETCSICHCRFGRCTCKLPCGHQFCQICISKWCGSSFSCPTCSQNFTRLVELNNSEPTGYVFSAKALSALYSSQTESESTFPNAQSFRSTESVEIRSPSQERQQNKLPVMRSAIKTNTIGSIAPLPLYFKIK